MIRVYLVETVNVLPHQSLEVPVRIDRQYSNTATLLMEPLRDLERTTGVQLDEALISASRDGLSHLVVSNATGVSCQMGLGTYLGNVAEVTLVEPSEPGPLVEWRVNH